MEVLPEDVRVWVKEHKLNSSKAAGEDYRQARKRGLTGPIKKEKQEGTGRCTNCGRVGHMAKDC